MIDFLLIGGASHVFDACGIVAAQNFHAGGSTADIIVHDAVSGHVDAHVRRGLIGGHPLNALEDGI